MVKPQHRSRGRSQRNTVLPEIQQLQQSMSREERRGVRRAQKDFRRNNQFEFRDQNQMKDIQMGRRAMKKLMLWI